MQPPKTLWETLYSRILRRLHFTLAMNLAKSSTVLNGHGPIISFTFDDFPRSALFTGGAILNQHGLAATYYVALGLLGKLEPTGEIAHLEDLSSLLEQNHELGCHTYSHCHSGTTPPKEFEQSIIRNRRALLSILPTQSFRTLSYPIATPSLGVKTISARHFIGCRGGGQTYNQTRLDLNFLRSYFIEQSQGQLAPIRSLINQNTEAKGWLIFSTHDVRDNPTPFGCTPGFFETVVELSIQSGAQILPVGQVIEEIKRQTSSKVPKMEAGGHRE